MALSQVQSLDTFPLILPFRNPLQYSFYFSKSGPIGIIVTSSALLETLKNYHLLILLKSLVVFALISARVATADLPRGSCAALVRSNVLVSVRLPDLSRTNGGCLSPSAAPSSPVSSTELVVAASQNWAWLRNRTCFLA
jgi:hypothetical protein